MVSLGVLTLKGPDVLEMKTTESKHFTYTYDVKYYINNRKYWCKGYYRNYCTIIASTTTETKNVKVDDNKNGQITVTLKDLSTGDSGDYWCGIEIFYTSDDMHYTRLEVNEAPEENPAASTQDQFLTVMSVLATLIIIAAVILLFKIFCSRKRTERTEVLGLHSSPSTAEKAAEDPEVDEYDCKYADLHIKPQSSVKDSQDVVAKEEVAYSDVIFK
ncbi:CMRF35-like molecule 7 isoform X2 [Erpetoichthys calabaricus]|uniref:CMRF35-like molecule 7 isoform X2 n=1 Tax=Erpetoichthys calabaricus TaxID=27687 RepID=UPI00223437EE|nr:CMRF35-like molecule 7 isoform X2 [Erpetoichthys calabaricus]